jgi:hypothetical protein
MTSHFVGKFIPSRRSLWSPEEEAFCRAWMEQIRQKITTFSYVCVFCLSLGRLAAEIWASPTDLLYSTIAVHGLELSFVLFGFFVRRSPVIFRNVMIVNYCVISLAGILLLEHFASGPVPTEFVDLTYLGIVAISSISPIFYPGRKRSIAAMMLVVFSSCIYVLGSWSHYWLQHIISMIILALGMALRFYIDVFLQSMARTEYQFRCMTVPQHLLQLSSTTSRSLELAFPSIVQPCVCLSSDWHDYQELVKIMTPSTLAEALDRYYENVYELLRTYFPEGTYFADWLGDEFFAVIYSGGEIINREYVLRSLTLAREILRARVSFYESHGIPAAVDIGIAAGQAVIGLLGHPNHRKATAIGETPGRSRRMQGMGKILRRDVSDRDRVIFGDEIRAILSDEIAIHQFDIPDHTEIRDVADRMIYFSDFGDVRDVRTKRVA